MDESKSTTPTKLPARKDRILGCLLGGALGDAIGAAFENQSHPEFSMPFDLRVTDDTQLTIATCEAIITANGVDPNSIAERFVDWFRDRRISGIGASTLKSLQELDAGGHWASTGALGERSAGNGAAMRIAPLAFFLDPNEYLDRRTILDVSHITHQNDEAYLGALAIVYSMNCQRLDRSLLRLLIDRLPDSKIRDRLIETRDDELTVRQLADRYPPNGFVVDSVPVSILAAIETKDFLQTISILIECGGDTDTIASMFGQIYGSVHGARVLPMRIAEKIDDYSLITQTAARLCLVFGQDEV